MYQKYKEEIEKIKEKDSYRFLRETNPKGHFIEWEGKKCINFSSNDYLGISSDLGLWKEFVSKLPDEYLGGSGSSRLLSGNSKYYSEIEQYFAYIYKSEAAIIFNSGYHANIGILPTLTTDKDLIISDKLIHASIIDGIRLSYAKNIRYRHNDLAQLEEILSKERHKYENVIIVTESVFSMDGDLADVKKMVEIKKKFNSFLYLDEAHSIGVFGNKGLGLSEDENMISEIDFIVGTLGKAIASQGAFLICKEVIKEYLVNKMRSVIFTTALPPVSLLWTKYVFERSVQMKSKRDYLLNLGKYFRENLKEIDMKTGGESQIVPVVIGENSDCIRVAEKLQKNGCFLLPVRPPTVPMGTARLRFSLTANMNESDIEKVIYVLKNK